MIDFAIVAQHDEGLAPRDAIYKACLLRFRPDSYDDGGGHLRCAALDVRHRTGSELRHPLGVSIVGGLLVSQVLTLFTTPVIYLAFDRIAARWRGRAQAPETDAPLAEGPA